jgi:hypothetical protein
MTEHISDELLQSVLESDEEVLLNENQNSHMEKCQKCRARLEQLAASQDEWSDAVDSLNGVGSLSLASTGNSKQAAIQPDVWREYPMEWTESMAKQLLDSPSHPEMLGRIGRYEVERLLGAGGMGIVFKAFDTELSRPVAIKLLAPHLAASGAGRKRFSREAKAAAAIVHEHVVPIYNVETEHEKPYMVMHFVAGESLQSRLDREGTLDVCEILRIARQIASGLAAAHAQGLVHRDIKPSNVLLEKGIERALLTDFGLARAADDATLTRTGFHPGTPQYMSPEQARGDGMDARSDLFSLGSVVYVMCTGRPPFRAECSLGILRKITDTEPAPIRAINPAIPEWLEGLVEKLMAKRIEDRFQSAAEVATIFEACLAHVQEPLRHPLPKRCQRTLLRRLFPFRSLHSFMNDKKVLSIIGLILFLAAVLVPFLLAGVAVREEHLLLFAAIAFGFSVVFAIISRKELFSRIVLITTGAAVVGGVLAAIVMVPFWGMTRSRALADERRRMEYEVEQLQNRTVTYADGTLNGVGRAEWEHEYLKVVEEGVSQGESYRQIVAGLKRYTTQRSYRNLQVVPFGEEALTRDANGNILCNFPDGFLNPLTPQRAVAIADELGENAVAFATIQINATTINANSPSSPYGPAPRTSGLNGYAVEQHESSALRIIVFFNSEGKSMAFGVDGVYVHAGIGKEKKLDPEDGGEAGNAEVNAFPPAEKSSGIDANEPERPAELPPSLEGSIEAGDKETADSEATDKTESL